MFVNMDGTKNEQKRTGKTVLQTLKIELSKLSELSLVKLQH